MNIDENRPDSTLGGSTYDGEAMKAADEITIVKPEELWPNCGD